MWLSLIPTYISPYTTKFVEAPIYSLLLTKLYIKLLATEQGKSIMLLFTQQ